MPPVTTRCTPRAWRRSTIYLRGVREADDDGTLSFTSIFPACYSGRWPHAHFEVYQSLDVATTGTQATKTSQLALPEDICREVYGQSGYDGSTDNLDRVSLDSDNVFGDGCADQVGQQCQRSSTDPLRAPERCVS